MASGYLKVEKYELLEDSDEVVCTLSITNNEVKSMFKQMIRDWFAEDDSFGRFVDSLFLGDEIDLNEYMNDLVLKTFSSFDTAKSASDKKEPEKFYHGLVLGLIVDRAKDYVVKSNRESGFGRYDVVLEPKNPADIAVIIEFKVLSKARGEHSLEDTVANALKQIEGKKYDTDLLARGITAERILKYGFAFEGEKCLIKKSE